MSDDRNYDIYQAEGGKVLIKTWTRGVEFEAEARRQVENLSRMPFVYPHVAIMPDVHHGMGATVGSVIPTRGAVIPAAVGVDIGCGMMAIKTGMVASDLPDDLSHLRTVLELSIPAGRSNNGAPGDRGAWGNPPAHHVQAWEDQLQPDYRALCEKHQIGTKSAVNHLGTLGTGNHFLEVCLDENQDVWVVLHSGSRGVGNKFGSYFIELARKDMERYFINLPDKDLAYLPEGTQYFEDYFKAVTWAQRYARVNRELMMINALGVFNTVFPEKMPFRPTNALDLVAGFDMAINCHHNYLAREQHGGASVLVTRKGAVRARKGDLGIIPGSMGARSYIVRGLGSEESLHSCSHGAGRRMSRTAAKKAFSLEDHAKATVGVECDKTAETLDETPGAYKDIDQVMTAQKDLVEVVHTLKQVLCIKGVSEEKRWKRKG
jgi:tRNA-splicing ligase RtcB